MPRLRWISSVIVLPPLAMSRVKAVVPLAQDVERGERGTDVEEGDRRAHRRQAVAHLEGVLHGEGVQVDQP
jgi:hypothetical protein